MADNYNNNNNGNNSQNNGPEPKKINWGTLLLYGLIILLIFGGVLLLFGGRNKDAKTYSDILELFQQNKVESFVIKGASLTVKSVDSKEYRITLFDPEVFLKQIGLDNTTSNPYSNLKTWSYENDYSGILFTILPTLLMVVVAVIFFIYISRKTMGESSKINQFSRASINFGQGTRQKVYFSDVAGIEEAKEELSEIVDYLKYPKKYRKIGAKIPRGVLLSGKPGTGKTLLARACAGEAGVPFLSISGSEFVEMFVGVGASRVRDLFNTAKRAHSAIIFIDEIDAVGRHRGTGIGGGNDEREQTLNQILVEMDGFNTNDNIIVIAATNRPDILDPALTRPGRFDRQVQVPLPDLEGRKQILRVHARNKPLASDVDFDSLAAETVGFTGADLANMINEAALLAARKNKELIDQDDLSNAYTKVSVGTQRKSAKLTEEDKRKVAYHECGHAITSYYEDKTKPVKQISIIPSGGALGYTLIVPEKDKYNYYKKELISELVYMLGGRAAEEIIFDDISAGAANDISRATDIAREMVMRFGMSDLGTIRFGSNYDQDEMYYGRDYYSSRTYSEETAALIDKEVKKLLDNAYKRAVEILKEHKDQLDFLAYYVFKHETITGEEFQAIMNGCDEATLDEMQKERREKLEKENEAKRLRDEERRKKEEEDRKQREQNNKNDDDNDPMGRFRRYR